MADGDGRFAVRRKGGPVVGNGVVIGDEAALSEDVQTCRCYPFGSGPEHGHIVGAHGRAGIVTRAAGDVDDELAAMIDGKLDAFFTATRNGGIDVGGQALRECHTRCVLVSWSVRRYGGSLHESDARVCDRWYSSGVAAVPVIVARAGLCLVWSTRSIE